MSEINQDSDLPLAEASTPIASQPDAKKMVQIPAETLDALFSSIESLRNEISTLKKSHTDVSAQLISLQQHIGVEFSPFPRLPIELRTMIWRHALTSIPQIHVLGDEKMSQSNINLVIESCKEAREEARRLRLDYLVMETHKRTSDSLQLYRKNYVNLGIDTFWLLPYVDLGYASVPQSVTAFCGQCVEVLGSENYPRGGLSSCSRRIGDDAFPIHTLAIHADSWDEPKPYEVDPDGEWNLSEGIVELLWPWHVQNLLIIVGDVPDPTPNTVFVDPYPVKHHPPDHYNGKFFGVALRDISWSSLEVDIVKAMQAWKDQRAIARKAECEATGCTEEQLDTHRDVETWCRFRDLSTWEIPTVKFVLAKSTDANWIMSFH